MTNDDRIKSPKAVSVEDWRTVLDELPDREEWAETLRDADIHTQEDRWEIEETIEHEVPEEYFSRLHDAFDTLRRAFHDRWSR